VDDEVLLETERLVLRRFTDTDADAELLFELDSDPEVMRYIGPFGLPSPGAYRERVRTVWLLQYARRPCGCGAAFEKATGQFVGWFFLRAAPEYKFAKEAGWERVTDLELGYRLRRAAWGRGLGTEGAAALVRAAHNTPDVTGVVAAALVTNRASWRIMEKVGMSRAREFAVSGFDDPLVTYAVYRAGGGEAGEGGA
jgi:RimJ/RimL family protein N-acetyltransferase